MDFEADKSKTAEKIRNNSEAEKESDNINTIDTEETIDSLKKDMKRMRSNYETDIAILNQKLQQYEENIKDLESSKGKFLNMHKQVIEVLS